MDDLFKSVPSLLEACSLQAGLESLLSLGGFRLTKWISNEKICLLQSLQNCEHSQGEPLENRVYYLLRERWE